MSIKNVMVEFQSTFWIWGNSFSFDLRIETSNKKSVSAKLFYVPITTISPSFKIYKKLRRPNVWEAFATFWLDPKNPPFACDFTTFEVQMEEDLEKSKKEDLEKPKKDDLEKVEPEDSKQDVTLLENYQFKNNECNITKLVLL